MDIKATILNAKAGDEQAQEQVLLYYDKVIFDVASGYQNIEGYAIDDLMQEGKILLTKLIAVYDENKGPLGALLRTALNNKFRDLARKKVTPLARFVKGQSTKEDEEEEDENDIVEMLPSFDPSPLDVLTRMDEMKAFYKSLQELLSKEQYEVMCLYLQNFSYKEIAEKLNLTTKKVDNLILASKKKIKASNLLK